MKSLLFLGSMVEGWEANEMRNVDGSGADAARQLLKIQKNKIQILISPPLGKIALRECLQTEAKFEDALLRHELILGIKGGRV